MDQLACEAVIFDLDGVLVDSTALVEEVWRTWAGGRGIDPAAVLAIAHGRRSLDTIRQIAPRLDPAAELATLTSIEAASVVPVTAFPGAARLVHAVPPARRAIVTSGTRPLAMARLAAVGLPTPEVMVTADDVTRGKPDPEGYRTAAARLHVPAEACVVVEDAPAGIAAARASGARVIAVTTTHRPEALAAADLIAGGLTEIEIHRADGSLRVRLRCDRVAPA